MNNRPSLVEDKPVETFMRHAICTCGSELEAQPVGSWVNVTDAAKPVLIPHKCPKCGHTEFYVERYPTLITRTIQRSKD